MLIDHKISASVQNAQFLMGFGGCLLLHWAESFWECCAVLRIRIGLNTDPNAVFYLNADPDPMIPSGFGSCSDFASHKVEFLHEKCNFTKVIDHLT
jgi:hypothetical protein